MSLLFAACSSSGTDDRLAAIQEAIEKLRPLARKLGKPGPNDWLAQHKEAGQTFEEYVASDPTGPTKERRTIYIQPLGDFSPAQRKVVSLTAEFIGLYFSLPVKVQDDLPLSVIPARARRVHPTWGDRQILTTYVLDELLKPKLPKDAVARIAFTASDLWPGAGWNFVFGQASLTERVGVWSIFRNGDPEKELRLCLLRTMKTATHETGHMFSIQHCTLYECNMCGSNHREESDRRPIACCPECVAKLWWITGADPVERYRKLAEFCREQGLKAEQELYEKSIQALEKR
jgi:archaemetzincin